jgi:Ca-activated chloride channel family protein
MTFHQPSVWFLLLLLLVPLLWWRWAGGRRRGAIAFSSIEPLRRAGVTWAVRLRWIVPAVRTVAIVLLVVCLARPQKANERTRITTEGIAIELVVDRSGSMDATDFQIDGRPATRLAAVKKVVEEFINGGDKLPGRPDDVIGLVTFATYADSACPPTLDHDHLISAVREAKVSERNEDRATALGDAIALGVERLRGLEQRADLTRGRAIKSRILIVLTDGESNAGDISPTTAARLAAALDVKVYTIGAGTAGGRAPGPLVGRSGLRLGRTSAGIDEKTLKRIAEMTGGAYFRATDSNSLEDVYAAIDQLERTDIEQQRFTEYEELALGSVRLGRVVVPPLLTVVFVLLAVELLLANTRFRSLP